MRSTLLGMILLAGCAATPAVPPHAAPPRTGDGTLFLPLESPESGQDLTLTVKDAQGRTVVTDTGPSGTRTFKLAPGDYTLSFALARGIPLSGCDVRVAIAAQEQTTLGKIGSPPACKPSLWKPERDPRDCTTHSYRGTRADIKTTPGDYDGYSIAPCNAKRPTALFYVTGHGTTHAPDNTDRTHDSEFNQFYGRISRRVELVMAPMFSGVSYAVSGCPDKPPGPTLYVSDLRQVDDALRRLGTVIREDDLGLAFTVQLISDMCLL